METIFKLFRVCTLDRHIHPNVYKFVFNYIPKFIGDLTDRGANGWEPTVSKSVIQLFKIKVPGAHPSDSAD